MNNFKTLLLGLFIALGLLACSKDDLGYQGDLTVTLKPVGTTEITEGDEGTIKYQVVLSNALNKGFLIVLKSDELADNPFFKLEPIHIPAGKTTADLEFKFTSASYKKRLTENVEIKFKLDKLSFLC